MESISEKKAVVDNVDDSPSDGSIKDSPIVDIKSIDEKLQEMSKDRAPFYKIPNLLKLYLMFIPTAWTVSITEGFDAAQISGMQSVTYWLSYFNNPSGAALGLLAAAPALGAVCGTPLISPIGDRFGRRCGLFIASIIIIIGAVLQTASVHVAMFIVARFILGIGLVLANVYAPILLGELAHPKERMVITSMYQTTYYIGSFTAAFTTLGTFAMPNLWSWRIPSILQILPAVIHGCCVWILPESPRWLIAKGRENEAKDILVKYHGNGNPDDAFAALEFTGMKHVIQLEMSNTTTWKTLVATPGNRRRMAVLILIGVCSQWSGNGLVSTYLIKVLQTAGVTNKRDQNILNGCLMVFNWISATSCAFLGNYMKRRTQFLTSVIGMLVTFSLQTLCAGLFNERGNKSAGLGVIPLLFIYYFFYNFAFNALIYSYPVEVLPYPIRAKGFSVLMFFGKSAIFVNAFLNPIGLQALGWKYYFVYVVWLCIELVALYFLVVETKGPTLEAIAEKFDKKKETTPLA